MGVGKIMLKRVAVVKSSLEWTMNVAMVLAVFLIEVRTDTTKCTNKRIAGFRKC